MDTGSFTSKGRGGKIEMAKKKSNLIKDLADVFAMLPWWVGVVAAIISYVALHLYAKPVAIQITAPGQVSAAITQSIFKTFASIGQYLVPAICLAGAGMSWVLQKQRTRLVNQVAGSEAASALNGMSWQEFEVLVGEAFRLQGFKVTELGGSSSDGGVDLVLAKGSEKFLVQCKQWRALKVGVDVVRELYGVMAAQGAAGGFVVTSGRYTADAVTFSSGRNVRLIDGEKLFAMLKQAKASQQLKTPQAVAEPTTAAPACPTCGAAMVKREAKRGTAAGSVFWGCSTYPSCRGTRTV